MMTPERYRHVERLLDAVEALPPADRSAHLDAACGDDPALRADVERLVAAGVGADAAAFLDTPVVEAIVPGGGERFRNVPAGHVLGHYRILSTLGTGGAADVYLAEDQHLGRRVALKVLHDRHTTDAGHIARLRQEARAASALNHPNIVTVYDIAETDGVHYIATEHIDGVTLRDRLREGPLAIAEAVGIATQVAAALGAAHAAGFIHRDIKPENVMLRADGTAKVLDFGLAKPFASIGANRGTVTEPGFTVGTIAYMSPEQARGLDLDARSDIFSLGVVLYEMLAGARPFTGPTNTDVLAAIVHGDPRPLDEVRRDVAHALARICRRCLEKDRDRRYERVDDLLGELATLTVHPDQEQPLAAHGRPRAGGRWSRKVGATGFVVLGGLALASWMAWPEGRIPVARESVLLADVINTTGDPVFDQTVEQALAMHLEQSPFLLVVSDERVRRTLRLMSRSPDERVTKELAREISQRTGIKAVLSTRVALIGGTFVISLEASNGATGEILAREIAEAADRGAVLGALRRASIGIRETLGESLASIQRFDVPIDQVTTSSLEALRSYSLGHDASLKGHNFEAIPLYAEAIALDPSFAAAHARLATAYTNVGDEEQSRVFAERAFALRARTSERERYYIAQQYYRQVHGDLDQAIQQLEAWRRAYPNDYVPPGNLSLAYMLTGQFDKAVPEAREALRIDPTASANHANLAFSLIGLGRYDEARAAVAQARAQGLDFPSLRHADDAITLATRGLTAQRTYLDSASGTAYEPLALNWEASVASAFGQLALARRHTTHAIDLATQAAPGVAARYRFEAALRAAAYGRCNDVDDFASASQGQTRDKWFRSGIALAQAICGREVAALAAIDDLVSQFPNDTLVNTEGKPAVVAAVALARGQPEDAVATLEQHGRRFEGGSYAQLWPAYLRGLAYLGAGRAAEAEAEFVALEQRKGFLLSHTFAPPFALVQLGRARAAALGGDTPRARDAYRTALVTLQHADADLPALIAARAEAARLR